MEVDLRQEIDRLTRRNHELEAELEEFQQSSRELERELEAQLEQSDKRNSDLTAANLRLTSEVETLQTKLSDLTSVTSMTITGLQEELQTAKNEIEQLTTEIRALEQTNDDLERAHRNLLTSLDEFDSKFNEQIEKNVLLECELGEKSELEIMIQRLKDEIRDLKQELQIQEQKNSEIAASHHRYPRRTGSINSPIVTVGPTPTCITPTTTSSSTSQFIMNGSSQPTKTSVMSNFATNTVTSNHRMPSRIAPPGSIAFNSGRILSPDCSTNNESNLPKKIPQYIGPVSPLNSLLSPSNEAKDLQHTSSRVSALNIVSDLLRKVGALESKLAACRNLVPPGTPVRNKSTSITPISSPTTVLSPMSLPTSQSTSSSKHH